MQPTAVLYFVRSLASLSLPRVNSALHTLVTADHLSALGTASRERFGLRQNGMIPSRRSRLANLARLVLWNNPTWCSPSIGALLGLVMVEWNVAASKTGSVGMWDTHFRLGGAIGTKMQVGDCPMNGPIKSGCIAASLMLHITPQANGYFENVWAWVADHDLGECFWEVCASATCANIR